MFFGVEDELTSVPTKSVEDSVLVSFSQVTEAHSGRSEIHVSISLRFTLNIDLLLQLIGRHYISFYSKLQIIVLSEKTYYVRMSLLFPSCCI